jgi:hypothetical protein
LQLAVLEHKLFSLRPKDASKAHQAASKRSIYSGSWEKKINLPFDTHQIKLASKYLLAANVFNSESV